MQHSETKSYFKILYDIVDKKLTDNEGHGWFSYFLGGTSDSMLK
jgi:hypothetical protein